jgi:hypothetical protein
MTNPLGLKFHGKPKNQNDITRQHMALWQTEKGKDMKLGREGDKGSWDCHGMITCHLDHSA